MSLQNPCTSIISDKWWYDTSQNWDVLNQDFESFSIISIADETFFALYLHISTTGYLEDRASCFTDVTDVDAGLDCRLSQQVVKNNCGQVVVTNFEEEVMKKRNEYALNNKTQIETLCRPAVSRAGSPELPHVVFTAFLSSCLMPAPAVSCAGSPRLSHARSSTLLSPCFIPAHAVSCLGSPRLSCVRSPTLLSLCSIPTLALLLPCLLPTPAFLLPCAVSALALLSPYIILISAFLLPYIVRGLALLFSCLVSAPALKIFK